MSWQIDHVQLAIPLGGEAAARRFWVDLLGMDEIPKPPGLAGRGGLWLRAGAAELHLGVAPDFRPATKAHPCFVVPDLHDLAARLSDAGQTPLWDEAIGGRQRFFVACPHGNRVEFMAAAA